MGGVVVIVVVVCDSAVVTGTYSLAEMSEEGVVRREPCVAEEEEVEGARFGFGQVLAGMRCRGLLDVLADALCGVPAGVAVGVTRGVAVVAAVVLGLAAVAPVVACVVAAACDAASVDALSAAWS